MRLNVVHGLRYAVIGRLKLAQRPQQGGCGLRVVVDVHSVGSFPRCVGAHCSPWLSRGGGSSLSSTRRVGGTRWFGTEFLHLCLQCFNFQLEPLLHGQGLSLDAGLRFLAHSQMCNSLFKERELLANSTPRRNPGGRRPLLSAGPCSRRASR